MSTPPVNSTPRRQSSRRATSANNSPAQATPTGPARHDLTHGLSQLTISSPLQTSSTAAPTTSNSTTAALSPFRSPTISTSPRNGKSPTSPSLQGDLFPANHPSSLLRKASTPSLHSPSTPPRRTSPIRCLPTTEDQGQNQHPSTPSSLATHHFQLDLHLHQERSNEAHAAASTVVLLHDSCYGHRFWRPGAPQAILDTIVERPERIRAVTLGLAWAYVRLGQRHHKGSYPIHPDLHPSQAPTVPFRIVKTSRTLPLTSPHVINVHGAKRIDDLNCMCDKLIPPAPGATPRAPRIPDSDLYLCAESRDAFQAALGGVCEAVDLLLDSSSSSTTTTTTTGVPPKHCFVAIRPPGHHCSNNTPAGFCWLNNVHIGINYAAMTHDLTHAAIIDFDLHHGDGSQAIAWKHNAHVANNSHRSLPAWKKAAIGYFSIHDINSYPCEHGDEEKVKNASLCIEGAHNQYMWNVHLQSWETEEEFWLLYEDRYLVLLEKTRGFLRSQSRKIQQSGGQPKGVIFISAGFDASEWESPGMQRHQVSVPTSFYARFTRDITTLAAENDLGTAGRVISVLEGGYSDRALMSGVCSHLCGLTAVSRSSTQNEDGLNSTSGLGIDIAHRLGKLSVTSTSPEEAKDLSKESSVMTDDPMFYDSAWWKVEEIERLEHVLLEGPASLEETRRPRGTPNPTYSSPTQASTARIHDAVRLKRSTSSNLRASVSPSHPSPPLPPPDVPWPVAVYELGRLLIPMDRPTHSYRAEELKIKAESTPRMQRGRQSQASSSAPPTPTGAKTTVNKALTSPLDSSLQDGSGRMTLRTRKPRNTAVDFPIGESGGSLSVEKGRRRTGASSSTTTTTPSKPMVSTTHPRAPSTTASLPQTPTHQIRVQSQQVSHELAVPSPSTTATPKIAARNRSVSGTTSTVQKPRSSSSQQPTPKNAGAATAGRAASATMPPPPRPVQGVPPPQRTSSITAHTIPTTPEHGDATPDSTAQQQQQRKIKINLITKAQKEARHRAELDRVTESSSLRREPAVSSSGAHLPMLPTSGSEPPVVQTSETSSRTPPVVPMTVMSTPSPVVANDGLTPVKSEINEASSTNLYPSLPVEANPRSRSETPPQATSYSIFHRHSQDAMLTLASHPVPPPAPNQVPQHPENRAENYPPQSPPLTSQPHQGQKCILAGPDLNMNSVPPIIRAEDNDVEMD